MCEYTQKNGCMEIKHRHTLSVARALRFHANISIRFWGSCVLTATHIINRTPTMSNKGATPNDMLFGKPSNYDHLKVFGCLCYVLTTSKQHDKFGKRAYICVFLGYTQGQKDVKYTTSRHVSLLCHEMWCHTKMCCH